MMVSSVSSQGGWGGQAGAGASIRRIIYSGRGMVQGSQGAAGTDARDT